MFKEVSAEKPLILLVDDSAVLRELYTRYFDEIHQIKIATASTEEEAVLHVQNMEGPAIVILDRNFKNAKGETVFGENLLPILRQEARYEIVTIFHSGDTSEESHAKALSVGAYWYLPKSCGPKIIMSYVWLARDILVALTKPNLDPLTGAFNRELMYRQATRQLSYTVRSGASTAFLMFDVDGLKPINDQYGHPAGDRAIIGVVDTIRDHLRETDIVCRIGGDEIFVILFDAEEKWAQQFTQGICAAMSRKKLQIDLGDEGKGHFTIGASVGAATLDPERVTQLLQSPSGVQSEPTNRDAAFRNLINSMMAEADKKLYDQKRSRHSSLHLNEIR